MYLFASPPLITTALAELKVSMDTLTGGGGRGRMEMGHHKPSDARSPTLSKLYLNLNTYYPVSSSQVPKSLGYIELLTRQLVFVKAIKILSHDFFYPCGRAT